MKFCTKCGAELKDEAAFCIKCGCAVNGSVAPAAPVSSAPVRQLATNRGLLKLILLSIITLGIYALVVMSKVSSDINTIASRNDGKNTMHFCLLCFLVGPITLGIGTLVWYNNISGRIGNELARRNIDYSFGAGTYWGWGFLGTLLFGIGPFIYVHKLLKSMNLLSEHYNING